MQRRQVSPYRSFLLPTCVSMAALLTGCWPFDQESAVRDAVPPSTASLVVNSSLPKLDSFCGLTLDGPQAREPMLVDCSCCSTFLNGDFADQVELLYGGHHAMARARDLDGNIVGTVPTWSLGNYVPEIVCQKGDHKPEAHCKCATEDQKTWAEFEPSCGVGAACRHQGPPKEWPTACAENAYCPERDHALGRDGSNPPKDSDAADACSSPIPDELQVANVKRRVSLGSSGRCEDMAPEQCHMFYAKVDGEWRHCKETANQVRQCGLSIRSKANATAYFAHLEDWAVRNAYLPGAWPVDVSADGTIKASTRPSRHDFMKLIGNLPKKMQKSYVV